MSSKIVIECDAPECRKSFSKPYGTPPSQLPGEGRGWIVISLLNPVVKPLVGPPSGSISFERPENVKTFCAWSCLARWGEVHASGDGTERWYEPTERWYESRN